MGKTAKQRDCPPSGSGEGSVIGGHKEIWEHRGIFLIGDCTWL